MKIFSKMFVKSEIEGSNTGDFLVFFFDDCVVQWFFDKVVSDVVSEREKSTDTNSY